MPCIAQLNGTDMNKKPIDNLVMRNKVVPELDGVTHINIHHKGKSELGRMLSHYYEASFTHAYFGPFKCVEGLWHYLKDNCSDDVYRNLNGHNAKKRSQTKSRAGLYLNKTIPDVVNVILAANYDKITQNPDIIKLLAASTLPFDQYYLHGAGEIPIRPRGSEWLPGIFEELRTHVINGTKPDVPNYRTLFSNY